MRLMKAWILGLLLVAALVPVTALAAGRTHVRLTGLSPLAVRGTGFHARERVVVTVRAGTQTLVVRTTSSATGAFTARFARTLPGRMCDGLVVTAVGARGDKAAWKAPPSVCGTLLGP